MCTHTVNCRLACHMASEMQYEYLWADGVRVKTPIKLSAPDYINALFDWVEAQVCTSVDPSLLQDLSSAQCVVSTF